MTRTRQDTEFGIKLVPGTLDDARKWIGRELTPQVGADAASASDFRRKMEVQGFECALHTDAAVARDHGYDDVVAPVTMLRPMAARAYWTGGSPLTATPDVPGPPVFEVVPGPGDRLVVVEVDTEYFQPVYPGDRMVASSKLVDVCQKTTSIGAGAFFVVQTEYRKQLGNALCGVEHITYFRYTAGSRPPSNAGAG